VARAAGDGGVADRAACVWWSFWTATLAATVEVKDRMGFVASLLDELVVHKPAPSTCS